MDPITEKPEAVHSSTTVSIDSQSNSEKHNTSSDKIHDAHVRDEENAIGPSTASVAPMTFKRAMCLLSLIGLFVMASIPSFLISAALSYIVEDIGGESSFAWIGMANTLATAAVAPFVGAISDLIGHRYVGLLGSAIVIMGLIVIGAAQTIEVCIGGSAVLGVGAALAEIVGTVGILEMATVKHRGYYIACAFLFLFPWSPSQTYAQLYSAASTWRWGAWISAILAGLNAILFFMFYRPPPHQNSLGLTKRQILRRIDYIGGFLSVTGFSLFLLGIQWGGYQYPWDSARVVTTIAVGGVLLLVFCWWEKRVSYPMFPAYIFAHKRISVLTLIITFLAGANLWSLLAFWPYQSTKLFGPDPIRVALEVLPFNISITCGIALVNFCVSRFRGGNRELLALSSAMMTAGIGALACVTQYTPGLGQGLSFLGGLGTGGIIQPAVTILTIISPDEVIATITAITISTRLVGASIGYSVYFNTLQKTLATSIPEKVGTAVVEAGLPPGEIALFMGALLGGNSTMLGVYALNVVAAAQEAMIDSYTEAFRLVYLVSIPFGVCAVIACLFLGDIKKYMSDRVAVDIH